MSKFFISLTFVCIALWATGLLIVEVGLEVHLLLILAGMSFVLKLIKDELKSSDGAYL